MLGAGRDSAAQGAAAAAAADTGAAAAAADDGGSAEPGASEQQEQRAQGQRGPPSLGSLLDCLEGMLRCDPGSEAAMAGEHGPHLLCRWGSGADSGGAEGLMADSTGPLCVWPRKQLSFCWPLAYP